MNQSISVSDSMSQHKGTEWVGEDEMRLVVVRIMPQSRLEVINLKGKPLRSINLAGMKTVQGWLSSNKRRNVMLLRVPKEYDLVIKFFFITDFTYCTFGSNSTNVILLSFVINAHSSKEKRNFYTYIMDSKRNALEYKQKENSCVTSLVLSS